MVVLDALTARDAPLALAPITVTLDAGAHAVVGSREDGAGLLLAAISGRARARSGRVLVLGSAPARVARAIAYVGREPALPEPLRVSEVLVMAADVRREPPRDPSARLEALGLAALAARPVRSLAPEEARAVALCEALTAHARVILLEEPFVKVDPRAAARLAAAVRARAAQGACVVVATSSLREAAELAADHLVLDRGALVRRASALGNVTSGAGPARLRIVASDARALVAALAMEPAVDAVEADAASIAVGGVSAVALAEAVARAAVRAGADVESLRVEAPSLEELRGAIARDAAAATPAGATSATSARADAPPLGAGPGGAR